MAIPTPTWIYRFTHIENLRLLLDEGGLRVPNADTENERGYRVIHDEDVQRARFHMPIDVGPGGTIHDYVPFYFGVHSPMMLKLKTGQVAGYDEGQEPLIFLVSTAQHIREQGVRFVFSDGHGLANFTEWYDNLDQLEEVDWDTVRLKHWADTEADLDRKRRKQAEFLVHEFCEWSNILGIAVIDDKVKDQVEGILHEYPEELTKTVKVRRSWYY